MASGDPRHRRYRRTPGIPHRWVDGTVVLAGLDGQLHDLQGGAALVWQVLEVPATVAELHAALSEVLPPGGAPPETAVAEAVALLADEGFVEAT